MQRFDKKKKPKRNSGILRFCAPRNSHSSSHAFSQFRQKKKKKNESNFVRYAFPIIGSEKKPFKIIAINEEIQAKKDSYQNKYVRMEIRLVS